MNAERLETLSNLITTGYWKDIDTVKGIVQNSKGPVVSKDERGYLVTAGYINNKVRSFKVHEIIAFVGGLDLLDKTVNHKDGIKVNNSITNLETITSEENISHAHKNGLIDYSKRVGEKHGKVTITELQAKEVKRLAKQGLTQGQISKLTGVPVSTVKKIRSGATWGWLEC